MDKLTMDKQTRAQFLAGLQQSDISAQIDRMDLHKTYHVISKKAALAACASDYHYASEAVTVKLYVTANSGTYGYQFIAAVWVRAAGEYYQASGQKTTGWGYDKPSTAIGSAFRALGVDNHIAGTGEARAFIEKVARKVLGRESFFIVES